MFIRPIKFSLVEVSPLGGGIDAPGIGTASKEGRARTGGGMAFCAGRAGDENVAPTDFLPPLGGVDIAYEVRSPIRMRSVSRGNECFFYYMVYVSSAFVAPEIFMLNKTRQE